MFSHHTSILSKTIVKVSILYTFKAVPFLLRHPFRISALFISLLGVRKKC